MLRRSTYREAPFEGHTNRSQYCEQSGQNRNLSRCFKWTLHCRHGALGAKVHCRSADLTTQDYGSMSRSVRENVMIHLFRSHSGHLAIFSPLKP